MEYIKAEKELAKAKVDLKNSKTLLSEYMLYHYDYIKDLHSKRRACHLLPIEQVDIVLNEIDGIEKHEEELTKDVSKKNN